MNTPRSYSLFSPTGLARAARRTSALLLAGAALATTPLESRAASATPPDLMAYQGFLVDANGDSLAPTTPLNYPAIFRIYTASTGGTLLWSEQQVLTVDKGNFSVLLGQGTQYASESRPTLSSVMGGPDASELYVGVTVTIDGTSQEILPRLRLMTSPYAFLATRAANLVQPNGTPVISYSGGQIQLTGPVNVSGTVTGNGSGLTGLTSGQIPTTLDGNRAFTGNILMNNAALVQARNAAGAYENVFWPRFSDNVTYLNFGTGGFNIRNNASAPVMFMQNGGNVGIGTTTPETRMQVGSYGSADEYLTVATAGGNRFRAGIKLRHFNNGYGWTIESDERDNSFGIYSHVGEVAGVSRLRIDRFSGNVGIGVTTPDKKLQIGTVGTPNSEGMIRLASRSGAGGASRTWDIGVPETDEDSSGTGYSFVIDDLGTLSPDFMVKFGSGNVGIGTSGPADRLHVMGALRLDNGGGRFIQLYRSTGGLILYGNAMGNPNNAGGLGIAQWDGDNNLDGVSDRRLKRDITDAEPVLERVMQLPVRRYHWWNSKEGTAKKFGVIAQEVEPLFPDSVGSLTPPDGMLPPEQTVEMMTVKHGTFGLIAVKALQELKQEKDSERDALKAEINQLKEEVARLKGQATRSARVDAIQQELDDLKQVVQRLVTNRQPTQTAALNSDR